MLFKARKIVLDLRAQQRLHSVVGELRLQLVHGASGIAEELSKCRSHSGLRPRSFKQNAVENLDLKEPVGFLLEESPPLVHGCLHNWIVIAGEGYFRPVGLEKILVDMEAGAERLERGLQPLDRILLLGVVEAFIVRAGDAKHHTQVAALGEKCGLIPEAIQVDVIRERGGLSPRFYDSIQTQHYTTSTRGMLGLAASYRLLYFSDFARMRRKAGSLFVTQ
ncbi:MAG: hypothetical protein WBW84_08930 [Acidobacteriaceae bacterium]